MSRPTMENLKTESWKAHPFTDQDAKNLQQAFNSFNQYLKANNETKNFIVSENAIYQYLTSGSFYELHRSSLSGDKKRIDALRQEAHEDPKDRERLLVQGFEFWRQNMLRRRVEIERVRPIINSTPLFTILEQLVPPKTVAELHELYRRYPLLNEWSAVHYQEGIGDVGQIVAPFVHVQGHRLSGYQYESTKSNIRLYLNPPRHAIPKLAMSFAKMALDKNIPFYFKFIDYGVVSDNDITTLSRKDRFIVYTNGIHVGALVDIMTQIRSKHPEWFKGEIPGLVGYAGEGVGITEEVTEDQQRKFGSFQKQSFNSLRAKMLEQALNESFIGIALNNADIRPRGGRTMKELVIDALLKAGVRDAEAVWGSGLRRDLPASKADPLRNSRIDQALKDLARQIIPFIPEAIFSESMKKSIKTIAPNYGIRPENLAANL